MDISQVLLPAMSAIETARMQEAATLRLVKDAIEFEGELALQLIPTPPPVDLTSSLGQNIDFYV